MDGPLTGILGRWCAWLIFRPGGNRPTLGRTKPRGPLISIEVGAAWAGRGNEGAGWGFVEGWGWMEKTGRKAHPSMPFAVTSSRPRKLRDALQDWWLVG
jgi:hypothetical protein